MTLRQFVPNEACLKCKGCCRFREENSVWLPCLLDEETQGFLDRKDLPAATLSADRRLHPVFNPAEGNYLCPFFHFQENKCRVYSFRPFECQLYPFLINLRQGKVILTVDLNCPYVKGKMGSEEFRKYVNYLSEFLNAPPRIKLFKRNPQLLQAYEEVAEVIQLNWDDEIK
jgi:Fe-S-cluster containining protein